MTPGELVELSFEFGWPLLPDGVGGVFPAPLPGCRSGADVDEWAREVFRQGVAVAAVVEADRAGFLARAVERWGSVDGAELLAAWNDPRSAPFLASEP